MSIPTGQDSREANNNFQLGLGIDIAEANEYLEFLAKFPPSKQICICGHTVHSHRFSAGRGYFCRPSTIYCPCESPKPVYCAGDARHFKRSTHGPGLKHALALGIASMIRSGSGGVWMVSTVCDFPTCNGADILPACVTKDGLISAYPTRFNVLLCRDHVVALGGNFV